MRKWTDPRMEWVLGVGDKLLCAGKEYTITGPPIGFGGSACVYPATAADHRKLAIKECMPQSLAYRREGVLMTLLPEDAPILERRRKYQEDECALSQKIASRTRRAIGTWECIRPDKLVVDGVIWDNPVGVSFSLMERLDQMGMSFGDMAAALAPRRGLMKITTTIQMIRQTVTALSRIHAAGYLHCDIQPHNIFFTDCCPEEDHVGDAYLLDFGCARKLEGELAVVNADEDIFTTRGYTPPELLNHSGGTIFLSKGTDLYAVGALLLRCVLSESMVRTGNTQLGTVDAKRIGCTGASQDFLNGILRMLLAPCPEDRYSTCEHLLTDLDQLLEMVTPPTYLLPGLPDSGNFVGRQEEIRAILRAVNQGQQPFVFGVGGYGKSELAVQAARQIESVKGAYFIPYLGTMRNTILHMFPERKGQRETEQETYDNNLSLLARNYRGAVLVIDNFWVMDKPVSQLQAEPEYADLMALCPGIKLIFTTRYPVCGGIEIGPLKQEELLELMHFHLQGTQVPEDALLMLIEKTQGHTLLLVLIAKLLYESVLRVTPDMVREALETGQLHMFDDYAIPSDQMGSRRREYREQELRIYLRNLFRLYDLDEQSRQILRCAALLPEGGMALRLFQDALDLPMPVLKLSKVGLLKRSGDTIYIHDLVRTAVLEELQPQPAQCMQFLDALWNRFDEREFHSEYIQIARCLSRAVEHWPVQCTIQDRAANIYGFLGHYTQALDLYHQKLQQLQTQEGVSGVELVRVINHIGIINGSLGNFQEQVQAHMTALCLLDGAVEGGYDDPLLPLQWENIRDEQDPLELAVTYRLLATAYGQGTMKKRRTFDYRINAYAEMALDTLERECPDAPAKIYLDVYMVLIRSLIEMGEMEDAMDCLEQARQILNSIPEQRDMERMEFHKTCAAIHWRNQEYVKMLEENQAVLTIAEKFYKMDHPGLAGCHQDLAFAYFYAKEYLAAIDHAQKAIAIWRKTLPPVHPSLARALYCLWEFHKQLDQLDEARRALVDAAEAGHIYAMELLGTSLIEGLYGFEPDCDEGFNWLRKSADGGSPNAAYLVGLFLLDGSFGEQDMELVEAYLMKGTAADPPFGGKSWYILSLLYTGKHPDAPDHPVDLVTAMRYLRNAEMTGMQVDECSQIIGQLLVDKYGKGT